MHSTELAHSKRWISRWIQLLGVRFLTLCHPAWWKVKNHEIYTEIYVYDSYYIDTGRIQLMHQYVTYNIRSTLARKTNGYSMLILWWFCGARLAPYFLKVQTRRSPPLTCIAQNSYCTAGGSCRLACHTVSDSFKSLLQCSISQLVKFCMAQNDCLVLHVEMAFDWIVRLFSLQVRHVSYACLIVSTGNGMRSPYPSTRVIVPSACPSSEFRTDFIQSFSPSPTNI